MPVNDANLASISRAIDFIENHLREEFTLDDVAEAAHYSLFHFCRMFNRVAHYAPYEYVMLRRISESARDLVTTDRKVIEIAFDYQFNSPETYTRAFKRMFAMQPSQWRKRATLPARALMPRLTVRHLRHLNQGTYLKPTLESHDALRLAGLMTHVRSHDDAAIQQLWEHLFAIINCSTCLWTGVNLSVVDYYGVSWFPDDWDAAGWYYFAAVAVADCEQLPAALVSKTLPAATYACFRHHGRWRDRRLTTDYVYHTWLPKSAQPLAEPVEIEAYHAGPPAFDQAVQEWDLWLPLSTLAAEPE